MITNFEKHTEPLSDIELSISTIIAKGLKARIGKDNAITGAEIISAMKKYDVKLTGARLRKIINYIRINNIVVNLCATSNGYYVASNHDELDEYIQSLQERIDAQVAILSILKKQRLLNLSVS